MSNAAGMRLSFRQIVVICCNVAIFLAGAMGIVELARKADLPFSMKVSQHAPVVSQASADALRYGVKEGDKLLSLNDVPLSWLSEAELLLEQKRPNEWITLRLARDTLRRVINPFTGAHITSEMIPVELQRDVRVKLAQRFSAWELLVVALCAGLFFAVGIVAYLKKPNDEAAQLFHGASALTALMITASHFYLALPTPLQEFASVLGVAASLIAPVMFLHFTYRFPAKRRFGENAEQDQTRWRAMYALVGLLTLVWCAVLAWADWGEMIDAPRLKWLAWAVMASRWWCAICVIWGVASFVHHYIMADEESDRRKLRWILLGLLAGPLTFALLWLLPKQLLGEPLLPREAMLLASTLTPLTFAISIVRYRLMDIDLIFNRGTVYGLMLGAVTGAYILVVNVIAWILGDAADWGRSFWVASLIGALALLFEPARQRVQAFVDKRFFRARYNYREAERNALSKMNCAVSPQRLASLLLAEIDDFLKPNFSLFLLRNENERLDALARQPEDLSMDLQPFASLHAARSAPLANPEKVEQGAAIAPLDNPELIESGVALIFPLRSEQNSVIGWLALGEKKSQTPYSDEDLDLLSALTVQASALVEKMMLQKALILQTAEAERLKELAEMRTRFVSGVSHDLRTPLTSIKLFAELLQSEMTKENTAAQDYLETIQEEIARLERMIANVLTFAKNEHHAPQSNFAELDLAELTHQTLERMATRFKTQNCIVETRITREPLRICGERDALVQALENLLSNAMKYSPNEKNITVEVFREADYAGVRVTDSGIGIAEEELPKIFEPFYRSAHQAAKQVGGTGLGLSLVKQTVEAHRGKIHVRSELGKGSAFTLLLPLASAAARSD